MEAQKKVDKNSFDQGFIGRSIINLLSTVSLVDTISVPLMIPVSIQIYRLIPLFATTMFFLELPFLNGFNSEQTKRCITG